MGYIRGRPLEPGEKRAIVCVKNYFDRNRKEFGISEASAQLAAEALEVGISTVKRVMADFSRDPALLNKAPEPKGRPSFAIDGSHEQAVRAYIREANQTGRHITLTDISKLISEHDDASPFHTTTLGRTLDRWGFEFGEGKRSQHLKEKDEVIVARQKYLRRIRANRRKNGDIMRPEIYLDESYVNKNHSNDFTWYSGDDGPWVQKPTGKGERLIIVNAISSHGWIPGAKLVFQAKRRTGDYHGQMNTAIFQKWFSERLLPNIPSGSLIIMDNASYHNTLATCSAPTPACAKERIRTWLMENGIPCDSDALKAELVSVLRKFAPVPTYAIDLLATRAGHEIIRTPPYHPELQPIELCWGIVKNYVGRHCNFTVKNLHHQLEAGFDAVDAATCARVIKKIRQKEDQFWEEDIKQDPSE